MSGLGDWVDMTSDPTKAPVHSVPEGVPGCPLCKGKGEHWKEGCMPCYDQGHHWTGGATVWCIRCLNDRALQRELKRLKHGGPAALLVKLIDELRKHPRAMEGSVLNEQACEALSDLARLIDAEEL
jgi:hypothetical protein